MRSFRTQLSGELPVPGNMTEWHFNREEDAFEKKGFSRCSDMKEQIID
jgi:hypothetical protein